MNVESFNLDHTKVAAPYLRVADRKTLPAGDVIVKFDVRFAQPNVDHLEMPVIHSIEHLFAEKSRDHSSRVLDFSPMGCQTGFYLIVEGEHTTEVLDADEVPAANTVQCGWGASHTLDGAKAAVRAFLAKRDEWPTVFAAGSA